jgi:hypothetical protein
MGSLPLLDAFVAMNPRDKYLHLASAGRIARGRFFGSQSWTTVLAGIDQGTGGQAQCDTTKYVCSYRQAGTERSGQNQTRS